MHINKTTMAIAVSALLIAQQPFMSQRAVNERQDSAPLLSWQSWRLVGSCGGVDFFAAVSVDDGRNDFEVKLKLDNKQTHAIKTRLSAVVESADGRKESRDNIGIGRLNGKRAVDACSTAPSLCFGVLFPSAVFQKEPTRIAELSLTKVEVANIDAPPANASPAVHLDPYRDYPHTTCRDLSITFSSDTNSRFISLTDKCVKGLPKWTKPECDDAVDEILQAFKRATSGKDQDCIKQWRDYQKCYEIYAFESSPVPRPSCERPVCRILNP